MEDILTAAGVDFVAGSVRVEPLATLEHSSVQRLHFTSGDEGTQSSVICKRAGVEGGGLDLGRREVRFYREIGDRLPAGLAALCEGQTVLHGDAHYENIVYAELDATLIDLGSVFLGPGEFDLAHAVALNLAPETRVKWESSLLGAARDRAALDLLG